jgi:asparagine synthase (glutamine-hydrolysing)
MCGIFGTFLSRPLDPEIVERAKSATTSLAHRGPDGQGEFLDFHEGVYFGHRRLKIIDLSEQAGQPMIRGEHAISYNGEIYNFPAIRNRLSGMGHIFRTTSDTEVVLEAWRHWGSEALDHLDGMFAFALWDGQYGWLAVDPFSEKQLYYAETNEGIVFSSELAVLAKFVDGKPDLEKHLPAFLTLGYISSPNTIYPNIKRLDPASWIKIQNGKIIDERQYWSPFASTHQGDILPDFSPADLDMVHEILVENISSRLISDVPICLFLSSGIDSALIAAITKKELGVDLQALTVSFPRGDTNDESLGATEIANFLGLSHTVVDNIDTGDSITPSTLVDLFGQPNGNISVSSIIQIAKAASDLGFPVGMTGLGGDELFFGYGKHAFAYRHRALYNLPELFRRFLGFAARPASSFSNSAHSFASFVGLSDSELIPALKNPFIIDTLRQIPGFETWSHNTYPSTRQPFEYTVAQVEMMDTMINSQLPAMDMGSMQASMEFRTPFLSRNLCNFMANKNWGNLMSLGSKWILKELLARYLPREMINRKKMGFVFPMDRFLDQFESSTLDFPFLPQPTLNKIWHNRHRENWRPIATRTALISQFSRHKLH